MLRPSLSPTLSLRLPLVWLPQSLPSHLNQRLITTGVWCVYDRSAIGLLNIHFGAAGTILYTTYDGASIIWVWFPVNRFLLIWTSCHNTLHRNIRYHNWLQHWCYQGPKPPSVATSKNYMAPFIPHWNSETPTSKENTRLLSLKWWFSLSVSMTYTHVPTSILCWWSLTNFILTPSWTC